MKKVLFGLVLAAVALPLSAQQKPVYLDASKPIEERVEDALSRLTLEEKVKLTHAQSKFSSAGVPRLGIPDVWTDDGPHGIRPDVLWDEWEQAGCTNDSCVAFPALTCLAATWNPEMSLLYGQSMLPHGRSGFITVRKIRRRMRRTLSSSSVVPTLPSRMRFR